MGKVFGGVQYEAMANDSSSSHWRPIVLEVEAENFCLWRYRGRADWVVVLPSPDEFLHVPAFSEASSTRRLRDFLKPLDAHRSSISHIELRQVLYGGPEQPGESVLSRYVHREDGAATLSTVPHTFIANPLNMVQAGVHPARPRPVPLGHDSFLVVHADPFTDLRINHYINAAGTKRCGDRLCNTYDNGAVWA